MQTNNTNGVAALIITYNPDAERLKANAEAVRDQASKVVIVDNASRNSDMIRDIAEECGCRVIFQSENVGIAKALNEGMKYLSTEGYDWVLTLDQDSVIGERLIPELMTCALSDSKCAIACPEINYEGWSQKLQNNKEKYQEVKACMTSASLTSTKCWNEVGGYDESYFIDFVDNEFCMKLKLAGYKVIRNHDVVLSHMLGDSGEVNLIFTKIRYSHHAPLRYYYMTRNNIVFVDKYKGYLNYPKEIIKIIYNILMGAFTEHNRETLKYIRLGINDARSKKMGRYED
ncbi:glycosyltransferase family 2 protein [Butyrivibrio sp. INlla14]|uniref:glycosyltransferase family 2 protein n=1 Tax=Butyrivibrio sp. INlla14 TaxID=1520808 RepID=UPI000876C277|nr:glycosyltransferase family 2 protein [Butyrivibrio sp. INlla14]SCX84533.1 rhamnosyltransferase [Butyrivibrio sp. INlla14]